MIVYLLKRLLYMFPILIGISLISFIVINLAPGQPTDVFTDMNPRMTPEIVEKLRKHYDLDKPVHIRYLKWLKNTAKLDFGNSFSSDGRKVLEKILERIPVTLSINLLSMILIVAVSVPSGIYISRHKGATAERLITFFSFLFYSIPSFWLAILLIMIFGIWLGILPISGLKSLQYQNMSFINKMPDLCKHLVLPIIVASFGGIASYSRYVASNLDDVLGQEYILLAKAKGIPEKRIMRNHAMRNALIPVITILGLSVPGLIGGSVISESIFAIPGMGQLFFQSVMSRDYPVIMGILVITSVLTLLGNLLADIAYAYADPRIRYR